MKKIVSLLLIFIAYPAFTQEDTYDNTLLCMNLNPYLKDSFIKFNNSASKAWVMDLDNYIDDTWNQQNISSQPDRWVIDMGGDESSGFKFEIILQKQRTKPGSVQVFKMTSFDNGKPSVASNSMICIEDDDTNLKYLLEDKETREEFKIKFKEEFSKKE
jgi:hypothetical protein